MVLIAMKPHTRWCKRCRINAAPLMGSNVCGSCADDLRMDAQADLYSTLHEVSMR